MGRTRCVFFVLLSLLLLPVSGSAQQVELGSGGDPERGFRLEQNYPNPFNAETRIPFELFEGAFPEGRPATVSMRIYNILQHYVGSPTALNHPAGDGTQVVELEYTSPGRYEAYWDGRNRSGQPVPTGVYVVELTVNGSPQVLRAFVSR